MKHQYLKLIFKIVLGGNGILIIFLIGMLSAESYELVNRNYLNVEIQKIFGKTIFEWSIDSAGFYNGPAKSWHLFSNIIRNDEQFNKAYWHGRWNEYDRKGNLTMIREWNMGELSKLFLAKGNDLLEIPKENWPKHAQVSQQKPQTIND